jgi:threonine/homoserine/homoserine lactone efflux protein
LELAHLTAFNAILLAAWIVPGPAMLIAMHANLSGGRAAGLACGLGLALTAAAWTLLALLGLDAIFTLVPVTYTAMKLAGGAYLLWIAVKTFRNARSPLAPSPGSQRASAFRRGLQSNLYNPKAVLFSAAALALVVPPGIDSAGMALVTINHFLLETLLYTGLALVLSTPAVQRSYLRAKVWVDRVAATLLGALGIKLLLDR